MSYEKNTWNKGDVITANKLNHMEDGIAGGGGVLICNVNGDTGALDHTWQEIHDATTAIIVAYGPSLKTYEYVFTVGTEAEEYVINTAFIDGSGQVSITIYECDSADSYPVLSGD